MTKDEIYAELEKYDKKDMILIDDETIIEAIDANDDWFELSDYDDSEDIGEFSFEKITYIGDFEDTDLTEFHTEDGKVVLAKFKQPAGCIVRYEVQ